MNKKNKNRGFSLIEVIVVIALMAIVTGATMSIYSWIRTQRIEKLTENLSDSISDLRTANRTKDGTYNLYLIKTSKGFKTTIYLNGGDEYKSSNLGNVGSIELVDASGNKYSISSSEGLWMQFDKSTGKLQKMHVSSGPDVESEIYINYSGLSRKIDISELTGKHYIE